MQAAIEMFFEECRMLARAMAPPSAGPYFLGSAFSLVDVALAPFWQRFVIVGGHYRGLTFPDDPEFHRLQVQTQLFQLRVHTQCETLCMRCCDTSSSGPIEGVASTLYISSDRKQAVAIIL